MIKVLVDHNIEGQAALLMATLTAEGWLEVCPIQLVTFAETGLPVASNDRAVWRFVQANGMLLLTDNRNMKRKDSLERTIREENSTSSLPVLTIGKANRMVEKEYRERCADRLVAVILDLHNFLGVGRVFIP